MEKLQKMFKDPPQQYKTMPQWSWNGDITKERITEQLEQFAAQGCGGLFMHARPGFITGYITDRWFEMWEYAMKEADRLGMHFHIYDEFTCPGGVAGGNTVAENPTVVQQEIALVKYMPKSEEEFITFEYSGNTILTYISIDEKTGEVREVDESEATYALVLVKCSGKHGGFPPPDLLRRETVDEFIKVTHDKYAEKCEYAFGNQVRYVFCDEPNLLFTRSNLPCSRFLFREFRKDHGYDLEKNVIALCFSQENSPKIRFDYWWTLNRLFNENFMQPLYEWCQNHNLIFTGHLIENRWPAPFSTPNSMASYRWMHAPGNDLLGFQFQPTNLLDNGIYFLNLKELSSVVNQLEPEWNLVETCGGRGYHTSFAYFKPCEDFTLSFGVNIIDPHLAHQTLSGIGKYDWPQTLTDHSPWWPYYRSHADHVARVNTALSQGKEYNRVLVLHSTTTGWLYATGATFDRVLGDGGKAKLDDLKKNQIELLVSLYEHQIDYDLGDEFIMEEFGDVREQLLTINRREYSIIVIPPGMENICSSTLTLIERYLENGGKIVSLQSVPSYVDGVQSDKCKALKEKYRKQWATYETTEKIAKALGDILPPYISGPENELLPSQLIWRRAETDDGTLYFFCNPWGSVLEMDVVLEGMEVLKLDTSTGKMMSSEVSPLGDGVKVHVQLQPRSHELLLARKEKSGLPVAESIQKDKPLSLTASDIERVHSNLLYVDYCDVEAYGKRIEDVNTVNADTANWQWQGFDDNPWGKQFRRTLIDRPVDPDSELRIQYRFTIHDEVSDKTKASLCACIERPWLYEVTINGVAIDQDKGKRWFDENMRSLPIGENVKTGENVIELYAHPFTMLCQVMPIYIKGNFSLEPQAKGFALKEPQTLTLGNWTKQGLPFYDDRIRYKYDLTIDKMCENLIVQLPEWEGSVAVVYIDGQEVAPVMHPPYECIIPGPITKGDHQLAVDIIGNMKNKMGTHFSDIPTPGRWSYQYNPVSLPPGDQYRLYPTGLYAEPKMWCSK